MTAVYMFANSEALVIASDGIAYDEDTVVRQIHTKQIVRPDLNFAAAVSSSGAAEVVLRFLLLQANPQSFDDVCAIMPDLARETVAQLRLHGSTKEHYIRMSYGGYSEKEGRFIGYALASRTHGGTFFPYVPKRCWTDTSRWIDKRVLAACGLDDSSEDAIRADTVRDGPHIYAVKTIFAARHSKPFERLEEPGSICEVGGFLELTTLRLEKAETQIVHRWPDEVGRRAEPENDPPMPAKTVGKSIWTPPDPATLHGSRRA